MDDKPDSEGFALEDARARVLNTRALIAFAFIALCMLITVAAVWVIPVALDSRHQT